MTKSMHKLRDVLQVINEKRKSYIFKQKERKKERKKERNEEMKKEI